METIRGGALPTLNRQLNIIRQKQETMAKEISEIKKAQAEATTMFVHKEAYENLQRTVDEHRGLLMGQHSDLAYFRKQHNEWIEMASAKENYDIWAYQQANPNLVEVPHHQIHWRIKENEDKRRDRFFGFLKSDYAPGESSMQPPARYPPAQPPPAP
ncbi:hypothetical protein PIB30_108452 [Stylosanthes scabra]|uniref:Uncharacterized protein n=1 Tax=Stylosanthes scabra TaxID=79078 RepID=A0ABU6ZY73_9FABA|nr:hypothetical protein [Stylosanthes scabra]